MLDSEKRWAYWNHFVTRALLHKEGGGHGVTAARLKRVEARAIAWDELWTDVERHGAAEMTPEEMKTYQYETYQHCLGNFWGLLYGVMLREGIIPPEYG